MFDAHALESLLELSRLTIPDEQRESLTRQLEEILEYFDRLSAYDTTAVDVDLGETVRADTRRKDSAAPGLDRETIRSFSRSFEDDGYFHVPRILGDDDG
mgnify:CR=1 FL=1